MERERETPVVAEGLLRLLEYHYMLEGQRGGGSKKKGEEEREGGRRGKRNIGPLDARRRCRTGDSSSVLSSFSGGNIR